MVGKYIITQTLLMIFLVATNASHGRPGGRRPKGSSGESQDRKASRSSKTGKGHSASMGLHDSFFLFPPLLSSVMTLDKFQEKYPEWVDIKYNFLTPGKKTCDSSDPDTYSPAKNSRWTNFCPLAWKINYDINRQPSILLEAECLHCDNCKNSTRQDNLFIGCVPVPYHTKVQRRKSHRHEYVDVWEPLTVGCVCQEGALARLSSSEPKSVQTSKL